MHTNKQDSQQFQLIIANKMIDWQNKMTDVWESGRTGFIGEGNKLYNVCVCVCACDSKRNIILDFN